MYNVPRILKPGFQTPTICPWIRIWQRPRRRTRKRACGGRRSCRAPSCSVGAVMSTSSIQFALPLRIPVRLLPREDFFRSLIKRRLSADGSILSETSRFVQEPACQCHGRRDLRHGTLPNRGHCMKFGKEVRLHRPCLTLPSDVRTCTCADRGPCGHKPSVEWVLRRL